MKKEAMPAGLEVQLVAFLTTHISWIGVFFVMAVESANIPIPSEITMPLAGWLLVKGTIDNPLQGTPLQAFVIGGLIGALGCLFGSIVNYGVGYYGGRPFVERFGKYILISPRDIARADQWFKRWGDWASFISRLLPVVRTFISFPAGMLRVNFPRFAVLTFVGSFIWCGVLALAGFIAGENYEQIRNVMRPFDYPIAGIFLVLLIYYVYRHIRHGRASAEVETGEPA